jgi:hypothetical protein
MAYVMRFVLFSIIFLTNAALVQCQSKNLVSYEVNCYTGSKGILDNILSTVRYLSFEDGLFEFILKTKYYDSLTSTGNRVTYRIDYDTIGYYYIDNISHKYYQIDTFSTVHRVIGMGSFKEKPAGLPIPDNPEALDQVLIPLSLRDSLINDWKCKVAEIKVPPAQKEEDRKYTVVFRENYFFNSIFSYTSHMESRKDWIPIVYLLEDTKLNECYLARIEYFEKPSESAITILNSIKRTIEQLRNQIK